MPEHRDYPLTDRAEIEECRRHVQYGYDWLSCIEAHDWLSAEELGAERDLELWGCNPFKED